MSSTTGAGEDEGDEAGFPLERWRRHLRGWRGDDAEARARACGVAPAALREVVAFFPALTGEPPSARVCVGTSCMLQGGAAVAEALPTAERVHCLGHCDASPCAAPGDGPVRVACHGDTVEASLHATDAPTLRPEVRCEAAEPVVTRNLLRGPVVSLADARLRGVYDALEQALAESRERVLAAVLESGERGRGGAGFPTGAKWRAAARAPGPRLAIANGDEGDPGSFVDRVLLEEDPHSVLEGLALCGVAIGAEEGVVFVRSEYPEARRRLEAAIAEAEAAGLLGAHMMGTAVSFRVRVATGFGSYVGGEETALIQTLEGRAGEVRVRPPYPVESGFEGRPTVVNNVETLVAVPWIVAHGPGAYRRLGTDASRGTKVMGLNAGFARPGLVEVEFGRSLGDVIHRDGETPAGDLEAVLLGGPMGSLLFPDEWEVPLCYETLRARGIRLGHGGLVAIRPGVDWNALLRHWVAFMARESCGKCLPCREGSRRARDQLRRAPTGVDELDRTLALMEKASLCAFGTSAPGPSRRLLDVVGAAALESRS